MEKKKSLSHQKKSAGQVRLELYSYSLFFFLRLQIFKYIAWFSFSFFAQFSANFDSWGRREINFSKKYDALEKRLGKEQLTQLILEQHRRYEVFCCCW